jgi:hypothetical protein
MFDADRQARLIYPPVFLLASLVLGVYLDGDTSPSDVLNTLTGQKTLDDWSNRLLALAAAGGLIVVIAAGFLLSSITVLVLRGTRELRKQNPYEADLLDGGAYDLIRGHLKLQRRTDAEKRLAMEQGVERQADALYLSAMLDHALIRERIHTWIFRRWSNFYVATNSGVAILAAQPLGWSIGVNGLPWFIISIVVALILFGIARWSWFDAMGMLEFQTRLLAKDVESTGQRKWLSFVIAMKKGTAGAPARQKRCVMPRQSRTENVRKL